MLSQHPEPYERWKARVQSTNGTERNIPVAVLHTLLYTIPTSPTHAILFQPAFSHKLIRYKNACAKCKEEGQPQLGSEEKKERCKFGEILMSYTTASLLLGPAVVDEY